MYFRPLEPASSESFAALNYSTYRDLSVELQRLDHFSLYLDDPKSHVAPFNALNQSKIIHDETWLFRHKEGSASLNERLFAFDLG